VLEVLGMLGVPGALGVQLELRGKL
jgi:hypothetical protein